MFKYGISLKFSKYSTDAFKHFFNILRLEHARKFKLNIFLRHVQHLNLNAKVFSIVCRNTYIKYSYCLLFKNLVKKLNTYTCVTKYKFSLFSADFNYH